MIDANSSVQDETIDTFLQQTNLHDVTAPFLPDDPPPTYQHGQHKIDHIWGTPGILMATIGAGILPFGSGPKSDHAVLYCDISLSLLSGLSPDSINDPTHPANRNLWSTDVKAAARYVELVNHGFQLENISTRIAVLHSRCFRTNKCTPDDERILNKIDRDITKILLSAEKNCKKAKGHAWSPLLANAGRTVIAAKWHLSNVINGRYSLTLWNRAEEIIQAKAQVKAAYAVLRQVQKDARKIRDSFLEDRADHLAETQQTTKAMALKQLLRAEKQAAIFRRLGLWIKDNEYTKLDRLQVPDDPDDHTSTWRTIVDATDLFSILTTDGQNHFRQAADTPFVTGPIADKLGPFDDNEHSDSILQGTFDSTNLTTVSEVRAIIKGMRYPDPDIPTPTIPTNISVDQFAAAIKHTRESTSSSPSGRHYGHYRTLLRDHDLLACIASLANICFQWGVTLRRWEKVIQPLIPKDPGTPRITRLRRIALIEADLNVFLSELFNRRLMPNAEKHGLLHPCQFGARKGKMAIEAVLLKRVSYDIIRQSRMDACVLDNDATACYDRMIPSIVMIKCRRAGMPKSAAKVVLQILKKMEYFVRTAYGTSPQAYSNAIDWILGIIQGSGHSCPSWGLTSSVMLDQMEDTPGATFHSPQPEKVSQRTGEAFIDDTTLWLLKFGLSLTTIVTMMQQMAQRWEKLLHATGGALNRAKCFWYGISWKFTNAGKPMISTEHDPALSIQLTSGSNSEPMPIQRIPADQGQRTLGVRLAPDGLDKNEFLYRLQQAMRIKNKIAATPLGREHIRIGFQAIWRMTIQYPLGATCFTQQQCDRIQSKYLPTFLSRMGINRSTATAVRHGPLELGGMDIFSLGTEQGIQQTKMLLSHVRKQDQVGKLLSISLDHLQLQAGVSWPVLSKNGDQPRQYVDSCYLTSTWKFIDSIGAQIRFDHEPWLLPQRQGDVFIMEQLSTLPGITPTELVHAQRCRLYLGVTTLADIVTSDGKSICTWATTGLDITRSPSLQYPRQGRPTPNVWTTWNTLLRRCFCPTNQRKLDQPLGPWYRTRLMQNWTSVIDPTTHHLYIWENQRVRIYERQGRSTKRYRYVRPALTNTFPRHSVPISGTLQAGYFIADGYSTIIQPPETQHSAHPTINRAVQYSSPLPTIAQSIWDGMAIMGSDGSVKNGVATYAWVLSTTDLFIEADVKGGGFLPPTAPYAEHQSKRPEAAALYAALTWIKYILTLYPNQHPTPTPPRPLPIHLDSKAVLNDLTYAPDDTTSSFRYLHPDFDIIQAIQQLIPTLPIKVKLYHVKSHQDDNTSFPELSPPAQINVLADAHATAIHQMQPHTTGLFPSWLSNTKAALYHHGHQVTSNIPAYVRTAAHAPDMKEYLIDRSRTATGRDHPWNTDTLDSIAWKHLGHALRSLTTGQRLQTSKFMNDLLPTRRRLQKLDNKTDGRCFACNLLWEDTNHVLCCHCEPRSLARTAAMVTFKQHLLQQHTPDVMATLICNSMDSWLNRTRVAPPTWEPPLEPIHHNLTRAFESQRRIGWDQFLRGRITLEWRQAIATYYHERRPGPAFTPDQWLRTTIKALWTFSLSIWRARNLELHGENGGTSQERIRKVTALKATAIFQDTIGKVSNSDSALLHRHNIATILNWTKQHLDAYLATAEVICEWNVEPG
jgi:hypothetical protein